MKAYPLPQVKPLPPETEAAALRAGATYLVAIPRNMALSQIEQIALMVQSTFQAAGAQAILVQEDLTVYELKR